MSEDSESGVGRKGSVRRARERLAAGLPSETAGQTLTFPISSLSQGPAASAPRRPPPVPTAFKGLDNGPKGAVISKPSPIPQWPLRDTADVPRSDRNAPFDDSPSKSAAPQRPPRPSNVPSLLDSSKVQEYTPSFQYRQQEKDSDDNGILSPSRSTDLPTSVRSSTTSSVGTIPDFPFPAGQPTQSGTTGSSGRKPQYLGPPPAMRRGPSSYYSSSSFVSPIPEEFPESVPRYGGSYASSKVIPSSWGSGSPESDILNAYEDYPDEYDDYKGQPMSPQNEETTLVRQASLGKRGKPSLRTINRPPIDTSQDGRAARSRSGSQGSKSPPSRGEVGTAAVGITASSKNDRPEVPNLPKSTYVPPSGNQSNRNRADSYSSGSELDDDLEKPPIPVMSMKELESGQFNATKRRPPRLNIDAVRESEARGSLTSLPDLIRRATRLASNLDRGKTASRFGMMDLLGESKGQHQHGRQSGISDILASFPPPGIATPTGASMSSHWPGPFDNGGSSNKRNPDVMFPEPDQEAPRARRQCCGMPRWSFILLCIFLVIIIAAAVIIPIVLIVLPRQAEAPRPTSAIASASCQATDPCQNGGMSIGTPGSCGCVCVGGFSGPKCGVRGDNSCVTSKIPDASGDISNVTMGSALPRLFTVSENTFNIPLNASKILALFSADDVSCTSENALVTFNGASRKRGVLDLRGHVADENHTARRRAHRHHTTSHRTAHSRALLPRQPQIVSDGDKKDTTRNTPSPTPTTSTSSQTSTTPSSRPSVIVPARTLDFARVAVLFMFERTGSLDNAIDAHDAIQSFFRNPTGMSEGSMDQSMGSGSNLQEFELDFVNYRILMEDGKSVGGKENLRVASHLQ
ncbi:hypothetical protein AJ80_09219 [Polytolypa hystricis UAMH7299]|uniref:EGF-like domain-containing protein n=1 Tax=Polytolypa hystricis (strain UAMH7299) TaxID=1447883 RepID=A0A2B7WTN5_POLH7|nr:hypothetical protein AJ80_09219 [Polytolypa hystricis UAMH7299]